MATTGAEAGMVRRSFEVEGKEYFVTPLTSGEWSEYLAWVQDRYIDVTKRNLAGLSDAEREKLLDSAFERASSMTLHSPAARPMVEDLPGMFRLVWMHLRKRHPDLTAEQVADLLNSDQLLGLAMERVEAANAPTPTPGKKKRKATGTKLKKKPRKRRKR